VRVLQVLGDTDADDDGHAALDLHRALGRLGAEVRTLALTPGRSAGLAATVPTMGPSAGSIATHTQLRREQRWADVVVLRGERPAACAGMARVRGGPPVVLHLTNEVSRWRHQPVPSRALRLAGRSAALVLPCRRDRDVATRLGVSEDLVHVVAYGVDPLGVRSDAERSAARDALGLPADAVVAHVLDGPLAAEVRHEAGRRGVATTGIESVDDRVVHFGEVEPVDQAELAIAAADVVVAAGPTCGPSWALLRAAGAGLAVIASGDVTLAELVDHDTGWDDLDDAATAGFAELRRRGAGAAARVAERFSASSSAERWSDVIAGVVER